ncbi:MAG: UDP-glucose/GDP-mannose dehydrogenase family protein [Bacteroidales bacterium]
MKITVIGTGYVGLVTGTCFAETGASVICVDNDSEKIRILRNGSTPIYEPGLQIMIDRNIEKGRLSFSMSISEAVRQSEIVFIAVGTPPGEDGSADLSHVLGVAREIGKAIENYTVVVNKSTVPVGTAEKVRQVITSELSARGVKTEFDVASNPEFLKEGSAVQDFLRPDRVVIGVDSETAGEKIRALYKPFMLNHERILFMDVASAELTKYAANAMLASRISFMNEIAALCELLGADINQIRKGIGTDSRIGNKFLYAGAGYGGSCFPKDVKALIKTATDVGYEANIIRATEKTNNIQKHILAEKVRKHFNGNMKGKTVALWGLAFKPNTDDIREAPALVLISDILPEGAVIRAYDPAAMEETRKQIGNSIVYATDLYEAVKDADILVLATEWPEFRLPDFARTGALMREKVIVDGRNIYEPEDLARNGFKYYGIGRKQ